ncbi:MAG: NAD-binding protein [Aurantimonas endophytica]|uniref:NAD-binding protein n=1 Tax=Aurantimonas endophytica TaxID=1522175 RepID=UPI0030028C1D
MLRYPSPISMPARPAQIHPPEAATHFRSSNRSVIDKQRRPANMDHVIVVEDPGKAQYFIERFLRKSTPFTVVCENVERVNALRLNGVSAIHGDALDRKVLAHAHICSARRMIVAVSDTARASRIVDGARCLNERLIVTNALAFNCTDLLSVFCRSANAEQGF